MKTIEETQTTDKRPVEINIDLIQPSSVKCHTDRLMIYSIALQGINQRRKYYSEIDHLEDVPHNIDTLFDELDTVYELIFEEIRELEGVAGVRK